jgi:hypothetical protein
MTVTLISSCRSRFVISETRAPVLLRRLFWRRGHSRSSVMSSACKPRFFYNWAKGVLRERRGRLRVEARPKLFADQERIGYLEKKMRSKDEVVGESCLRRS